MKEVFLIVELIITRLDVNDADLACKVIRDKFHNVPYFESYESARAIIPELPVGNYQIQKMFTSKRKYAVNVLLPLSTYQTKKQTK